MAVKQQLDIRDEIMAYIKSDRRSLRWLSDMTEIPYSTMYAIFGHKIVKLSQDKLDTINNVLQTDFKMPATA